MDTLPAKPSALIEVALEDLAKCRKDQFYTIEMDSWHTPLDGYGDDWHEPEDPDMPDDDEEAYPDTCLVCFAGAVMAQTLGQYPQEQLTPADFPVATQRKLEALDEFRKGRVFSGLLTMGIDVYGEGHDEWAGTTQVCPYRDDPDEFRDDMISIADQLETHNL